MDIMTMHYKEYKKNIYYLILFLTHPTAKPPTQVLCTNTLQP